MSVQSEHQSKEDQDLRVDVLLATYNGERFLPNLLSSLKAQSHDNWRLLVSDDGSHDRSLGTIREAGLRQEVKVFNGPKLGAGANFVSLVKRSYSDGASYAAFCDQDDVWFPDKLERAQACLRSYGQETPALYFSTQELIDENGRSLGINGTISRPPSFRNALVQNIAAGCTTLMNRPAMELLAQVDLEYVALHDWLAYLLITGAGGIAVHDPQASVYYRQHGTNEIGANRGPVAAARRLIGILRGHYRCRNQKNLLVLSRLSEYLTPENRKLLLNLERARASNALTRLQLFRAFSLYRQSRLQQATFWFAVALGKF